ncbi:MAG: hypothetical protein NZU63_05835 [Gemmataceae bacterium]|nr:hypothetical protein [Gemmataceae bacterium]
MGALAGYLQRTTTASRWILVAVLILVGRGAGNVRADEEPGALPLLPTPSLDTGPSLPVDAEGEPAVIPAQGAVIPAQGLLPLQQLGPGTAVGSAAVVDPPPPLVRIQVRVPATAPPGKELTYQIVVRNTSSAPAYNVTVRNPLPEGATFVAADPAPEKSVSALSSAPPAPELLTPPGRAPGVSAPASAGPAVLVWKVGTLGPGESRTIRLTLQPKAETKEIRNLAYVSYEYGQAVTTRLRPPMLKVSKAAPRQIVRDEPGVVRIVIDNVGSVPVEQIRIVENVPASAEIEPLTGGGKRTNTPEGTPTAQQWVWEIPRLWPGQRHSIEYRLVPRESRDVLTLTHVSAAGGIQEKAEATLTVLTPGLAVQLTATPGNAPVAPGEVARLEILVRNTGTLPAMQVRVSGTIPPDCKPVRKTEGGQWQRDLMVWFIPRLEPGEARTFRYELKAATTGRRTIVAAVSDARGQQARAETAILFQGAPALNWETVPQPATLRVGQQGTLTIRLRNNGGDTARNVRLEITLPEAVAFRTAQPPVAPPQAGRLFFPPQNLAPGSETVITITYEARQPAQAFFRLRLLADHLGDQPMQTEKAVEILGDSSDATSSSRGP